MRGCLPPNTESQLLGDSRVPSGEILGSFQMYHLRLGLSSEERDSLNHSCFFSHQIIVLTPKETGNYT